MSFDVFDLNGKKRDMEWLREKYGNVQFLDAGPGRKFKLMRVDETVGPAVIKVRVLNEAGQPQAQQPVANHWPDPNLPDLRNKGIKSLWHDRALSQNTGPDGFSGFGIGPGSYIRNFEEGGAHTLWVLSPSLPSDGLSGVGMLGGTNHMGPLFLTFQIATEGEAPEPEPPEEEPQPTPEPSQELMDKLDAIQDDLRKLMDHFGIE